MTLREAGLFADAETMLTEVLGRIRDADRDIELPGLSDLPGASGPTSLGTVVQCWVRDDACVPHVLRGEAVDAVDVPVADAVDAAADAVTAARAASDGLVRARYGEVSTRYYLLRLTVNRSLIAHYVAAYLGSTACPLPEDLARSLHELTGPDAAQWRAAGIFAEPMAVPHLASWRDTFLLTAGHLPHPLGH